MAVVKVCQGGRTLGQAVRYAAKGGITSGKDCPDDTEKALEQMRITKEIWKQTDGRQYKHYVVSFAPGEITPEQAGEFGDKWAKENFPGYEVFMGTHIDKEHIHVHFVVNSVNFEDGHKIHLGDDDLERFKSVSDNLCREKGLSVIDRTKKPERGEVRTYDMNKYQVMKKGNSWQAQIADAVEVALQECEGKGFKAFKENLKAQGLDCELRGDKHITFKDADGNKIRGAKLAKEFSDDRFSRSNIENTIGRQQGLEKPEPIKIVPKIQMQSVADIQRSSSNLGADANRLGSAIQSTINSNPKVVIKTPQSMRSEVTKKSYQTGGGMSFGSGGRSVSRDINCEHSRPTSGGLSVAREKDEEDQIRDLMDKGMSEDLARKIIQGTAE